MNCSLEEYTSPLKPDAPSSASTIAGYSSRATARAASRSEWLKS
eukprot:CAMPEP_0198222152 /NCGR_PEP_ID=MMETSP1445-20131203/86818_1 /TAXON_ID=36898 /ORGANISM="Pyramimonas sp., Strain CCMP2087" /LENGTH=43 /DNA_ID= /DNA_START= /DNA_END= /DNA_ORIENTATION=